VDAEAADFSRIRGMGVMPMEELGRVCCAEDSDGVVEDGYFGREARFSLRTTMPPTILSDGKTVVW
jgi:hypothetical protein